MSRTPRVGRQRWSNPDLRRATLSALKVRFCESKLVFRRLERLAVQNLAAERGLLNYRDGPTKKGVRTMPEMSLDDARRLINEIEQPGNDPTPRLLEIASILVGLVEQLTTRVDELDQREREKAHRR